MTAQEQKFTDEDKQYLYQIFANGDHEVREGRVTKTGKVQWFVYLTWEAIQHHLENRFFGEWQDEYHSHRDLGSYSEVYCRLTIRGIARENNGSNSGNSNSDENQGKGAATDAFKRVAAKWGIGLYLRTAPTIYTPYDYKDGNQTNYDKQRQRMNEALQQVYKWLDSLRSGKPQSSAPSNVTEIPQANGKQETGVDSVQWQNQIKALVQPLYVGSDGKLNPFHMDGSIKKAIEAGIIGTHLTAYVAAAYLLVHRAEADYGLDTEAVQAILGGKVSDTVQNSKDSFASAWSVIRASATQQAEVS